MFPIDGGAMLNHTFCHIPGIGPSHERTLWRAGIDDWSDLHVDADLPGDIPPGLAARIAPHIPPTRQALAAGDCAFFSQSLPPRETWRLFPAFRGRIAYLDIETTGVAIGADSITTVSVYDGRDIFCLVRGRDLHSLPSLLARYDVLVTYNGKAFDVPCIQAEFGIRLPHAHIDLCHVCHSLGITGGLKKTEQRLGIARPGLDGIDGYAAVILWELYARDGDQRLLDTLMAYNIADTVNLEKLMVTVYNLKLRDTPFFPRERLEMPVDPELPCAPDPEVVADVTALMSPTFF